NIVAQTILVGLGTIVSGVIFLSVALFVIGSDVGATFAVLFASVVLPAVAFNAVAFVIIYKIVTQLLKRSKFKTSVSH
ncbi:MAG: tryptophan transporter, partial [Lysinibacillus sp.]